MKARQQSGFTLIELVMVIVILGILAVVAIPQFINLRTDAQEAATDGVAGSLSAASAINYAGCQVTNNVATAGKCVTVNNCSSVAGLLQGGVPTGYAITAAAIAANGTVATCDVVGPGPTTRQFTAHGAGI